MIDENTVIDVAPALRKLKEKYPNDWPAVWVDWDGDKMEFTLHLKDPTHTISTEMGWGSTMELAITALLERAGPRDRASLLVAKRAELETQRAQLDAEIARLAPKAEDAQPQPA